jgi:hypothetical protein
LSYFSILTFPLLHIIAIHALISFLIFLEESSHISL